MSFLGRIGSKIKLSRALAAERAGDYAGALAAYREIVGDFDRATQAQILNKMGMLAYGLKDMATAKICYEQALAITPGEASVLMNLANALHQLKEAGPAQAAYEKALGVSKNRPDVLYNYAVFMADRDPRRAADLLRQVLESPAQALEAITLPLELPFQFLVQLAARHGLVDETAKFFETLEQRPWANLKPWIMNQHAILLSRGGRHEEALALYRKIIEAWPKETDVRFNLGMALVRLNRLDEALPHFRATDHPASHYGIAHVHELRGEVSDAVREYTAFLEKIRREPPDPARASGVDLLAPWIDHARQIVEKNGP